MILQNFQLRFILLSLQLICWLMVCSSIIACSSSESSHDYEWNLWIYLDGDNDLSDFIEADYNEIIGSISSNKINICVQIDLADQQPARRIRVVNGEITLLADIGETDTTSPETLSDFLIWAKTQGGATKNLLILSDHGNGWDQQSGPSPNSKMANRAMFSDSDNNKPPPKVYLHNHLIADAIADANVTLDILGLDASLMAGIETLYEFAETAPILIASQEVGNAEGWNYKKILAALADDPQLRPEPLAKIIIESYQALMEEEIYPAAQTPIALQYHTISAVRTASIKTLAKQVSDVAIQLTEALTQNTDATISQLTRARENSQAIDRVAQPAVYVDLYSLFSTLDLVDSIDTTYQEMLIAEYHGVARPEATGLNIVFYAADAWELDTIDSQYKNWNPNDLSGNKGKFINEFMWDEFLAEYYARNNLNF